MDGQLPEGWAEHQDPQGRVFYYNSATSESTYDPPWLRQDGAQPPPPQELPAGWVALSDPASGKTYYYNSATGETSWDPPAPVASTSSGQWSLDQTYGLGPEGYEHLFQGRAPVLDRSFSSVSATVDALISGSLVVDEGICVLYSASRSLYFLLWRDDKTELAKTFFMWSGEQAICLGPIGNEQAFEGKAELLPKESYSSVSQTINSLILGELAMDVGYCVVFSDAHQLYFLVYRTDKEAEVAGLFTAWQSPDDDQ